MAYPVANCDICGDDIHSYLEVHQVSEPYSTGDVGKICPSCSRDINKALGKAREISRKLERNCVKRRIRILLRHYRAVRGGE